MTRATWEAGKAGQIEIRFPEREGDGVELDLDLSPATEESGFLREALSPVFDYLFTEVGTGVVRTCSDPEDEPSRRLLSGLGMVPETLDVGSVLKDGEWVDRLFFALTPDRWNQVRGATGPFPTEENETSSDFWAVTSFFNPAGYRRHREKYRVFRDRLGVPLVAVELAYGEAFELGPGDADRLLRLRSDQVLWQKERLLNLAVGALPPEARYVAWVDSDVVFDRTDWAERTREALESYPLVQPYGRVHDLPPGAAPSRRWARRAVLTRPSLGSVCRNGGFDPKKTSLNMLDVGSPGHAWAMKRAPLEETGLYDAMILGSGDNAIAMAALGHADAYADSHGMNGHEAKHYRRWAQRFHAVVQGEVGFVSGDLYHLWHGDLSHRGYGERYPGLAPYGFNPEKDIAQDDRGVWRWASEHPDLHEYVSAYFGTRREDG